MLAFQPFDFKYARAWSLVLPTRNFKMGAARRTTPSVSKPATKCGATTLTSFIGIGLCGRHPSPDAAAGIDRLSDTSPVVAADHDRIAILGEAGDHADMPAASAAHCHDRADLRRDALVAFPGESPIVDIPCSGDLPEERRAPQGASHTDLMGGLSDELARTLDHAGAVAEPVLERVKERRLLLRGEALHDAVMMVIVMSWAGFGG
ncbi:hypothetical protein QA639_21805 [Bradyrhizobium pachyrhizi]|nr:hypothetical protein [Bradyrhizobium pachyrhizi]WFU52345.1 hypothetical protein QA639_21805 [Bradyrhizobium pachyrhizi]